MKFYSGRSSFSSLGRLSAVSAAFALVLSAPAYALSPPGMPDFPVDYLPDMSEEAVLDRLGERLSIAPGMAWFVEGDLVVPALPDYSHLLGDLPELPQEEASQAGVASSASGPPPSLAAALLGASASSAGLPLGAFISQNMAFAADLTGLPPLSLSGINADDVASLDASLRNLGFESGMLSGGSTTAATLLSQMSGDSVDARVVGNAAGFARSLWGLNMPPTPSAAAPDIDAAAVGFGLLTSASLASLAAGFPDVLSDVSSSGLGSEEASSAWRSSMALAFEATRNDISEALPSACLAGMLSVAASGSAASAEGFSGCGADCVAAGVYLNNHMLGLWSPSSFSPRPSDDDTVTTNEMSRLPSWLSGPIDDAVAQASPPSVASPGPTTSARPGIASGACSTAAPAAGALSRTLPDLMAGLTSR